MKILQQGAEAIIFLENNKIRKHRIKKSYRLSEIDIRLRKSRTKSEAKIIEKLSSVIPVPKILETDNTEQKSKPLHLGSGQSQATDFLALSHQVLNKPTPLGMDKTQRLDDKENIIMEFIDGKKLSEELENLDYKKISAQIGGNISKLHDNNIIHGDLTTSNMILKNNQVYFIDFGLSFHSHRIEDKAVDLHLLKQALEAKHFKIADECIKIILENYKPKQFQEILERLKKVESRGRYKERY